VTTAAQEAAQRDRGTIFVEDGELLSSEAFEAGQYVMRIRAPKCASAALPGSFVHMSCDDALPMRRPMSIMRARDDWIEILFKTHGHGLTLLARKRPGDPVSLIGPIGRPFRPDEDRPHVFLIGGGVGIPPMVFVADALRARSEHWRPLAILGSEIPFPFPVAASSLPVAGVDDTVNRTMPLLESWGIPARLATLAGYDGCFDGYVTDLAEQCLAAMHDEQRERAQILACGPTPMLEAVARLADRQGLPCQVSLEEYMACAVGGCAGCAVRIETPDGPAMKRVCVDGPVFDAATVAW